MRTCIKTVLGAGVMCALFAGSAVQAAPDPEIPVVVPVRLRVPGQYHFKYALFDRDGSNPADSGTEIWSEEMNTAGPRRRISSKRLSHRLGSIASPQGPLSPADFSGQLWLQVFRWLRGSWSACSSRVKLTVAPYALYSVTSETSSGVPGSISQVVAGSGLSGGGASGAVTLGVATAGITAGHLASNSVNSAKISDGSVSGADVQNESLTGADIQDGSLTGADIQDGSVSGADVQNESLTGADIQNGSLTGAEFQSGSVSGLVISDRSLSGVDIGIGSISHIEIGSGAVGTSELVDAAVTNAKLDLTTTSGRTRTTSTTPAVVNLGPQAFCALTTVSSNSNSSNGGTYKYCTVERCGSDWCLYVRSDGVGDMDCTATCF